MFQEVFRNTIVFESQSDESQKQPSKRDKSGVKGNAIYDRSIKE
jgi:hypothetical protein